MKTKTVLTLLVCGSLAACVPDPKNGGSVDTGTDDSATSSSDGSSDGTLSGGSASSTSGSDSSDGSTGGGVPAACEAAGWDESFATYQSEAELAGASYWYTQAAGGSGAFELTCGYLTTVEVVEGTIVRRTFEITEVPEGVDETTCPEPYVEEGEEINSHQSGYDPPALLMEAQYEGCCSLLAIEPADEYDTYFNVDDAGIASSCGAVYANCADGCNVGVDDFGGFSFQTFSFGLLE